MAGLLQDVRYALRQLRKSPGFAITAVLMLALGICANSTAFSWINGTLLHPIPGARNTGELVSVLRGERINSPAPPLSYLDYRDLRDHNQSFSGLLAYRHDWLAFTDKETNERIYAANVSSNYFEVLGVQPLMGRFFLPQEETVGSATPSAVLSYSLWQTRFAGDPAIVGKSIEIAQKHGTVIGVAPQGFIGAMPGIRQDIWFTLNPLGDDGSLQRRGADRFNVIGRLRPGISRQQAESELDSMMRQIVAAYPDDHIGVNTIFLDPMWRSPFGANVFLAATLPILLLISGVVLLLTCANVATLALVRFVSRRRELAIRQSLGAGRVQLMRQMILEGLLVALAGGTLAILLTLWTAKMFALFIPPNSNPILLNGRVDAGVLLTILALAVGSSVLCGAIPAWRSSRVQAAQVLKEEAASTSSNTHNRHLLSGLVVVQIALSLALLITAGLLLRTLRSVKDANPGFEQDHVLTASVGLGIAGYNYDQARAIRHKLIDRISVLPGVTGAALTDWVPMNFTRKSGNAYPEGYVPTKNESLDVRRADVSAGYFASLGIPVVEGREFTRDDNETAPLVAIVDQTAAAHYWPGQDPVGRRLNVRGAWYTVVGVVMNTVHQRMNELAEPMVYLSFFQAADGETILQVRTAGNPEVLVPLMERAVHEVDTRIPVYDVRPLRETTGISNLFPILESTFATVFAILALVLAATGIYGVIAYRTQLRTHEIGIRVALGAGRAEVMRMVLFQGLRLTLAGIVLGLALAYAFTRFFQSLLYGVSANDPLTAACVTALLTAIALIACYMPAFKAARIDPVSAIRAQ